MKKINALNKSGKTCVIAYSASGEIEQTAEKYEWHTLSKNSGHDEFAGIIAKTDADIVVLIDTDRQPLSALDQLIANYIKQNVKGEVGYCSEVRPRLFGGLFMLKTGDYMRSIQASPVFIGRKADFTRTYAGGELADNPLVSVAYTLYKSYAKFKSIGGSSKGGEINLPSCCSLLKNYLFKVPFKYLFSGSFFKDIRQDSGKAKRDMVYRMLFVLFVIFSFLFMPYISKDYGVSGDEFVDHRHAGYVLDYFENGDKTALDQPQTALHLYGNSVQVITAAVCRWFNIDNYYEARHVAGGLIGALGVLFAGLMGLRWGGGLCGLLAALLMFFTPRYFGHSMNNLKDVPFAVGYLISIYYIIRLFDWYSLFRIRHAVGLIVGLGLALGTRSGGLILYPMFLMYAGLYYMLYVGVREFYKFGKYSKDIFRFLMIFVVVGVCGYILAILLWPFALQDPFKNVLLSLEKFTNFSIGLRTIFDGEQMMSNMLPWKYAPQYLIIGMPLVTVLGFFGYMIFMFIKRKEFSLVSYFLLFAAIFPVFWVIYKSSNLYGGIRHLLFVMPMMVIVAARCWSLLLSASNFYLRIGVVVVFLLLFSRPVVHAVKNHPNEYVYFNELIGGMKGGYGNYDTDYYFNSLKESSDWFKRHVKIPEGEKVTIVTQAHSSVAYYFRNDPNVKVIYSRYYEKYSKDWDYAILGNVYVSKTQLRNGQFPPEIRLYAPSVDGCPMSAVVKRPTKRDWEAFSMEKQGNNLGALHIFEDYVKENDKNEEVWARMAKLYYITRQMDKADKAADRAIELHPKLSEALYMSALINMEQKDYKKAMGSAQAILQDNASSSSGNYLVAQISYETKKYKNAIDALNKVLTHTPDDPKALLLATNVLKASGQYANAIPVYNRLLKNNKNIDVLVGAADCYARLKKYNEAENMLNQAYAIQANYYPIYKVYLRMYLMLNELDNAQKLLTNLQDIDNDAELFVLRAKYMKLTGNEGAVDGLITKALELDKENAEALELRKK
ncbi:tetratricopeptide repeat protein [Porphyromonadaceae bacterium OttesenSCG-928-L07]|nr:tetratricopeptide repeat protein [Porphyromonadaceae bacterium OttesenSCG-928-L07]